MNSSRGQSGLRRPWLWGVSLTRRLRLLVSLSIVCRTVMWRRGRGSLGHRQIQGKTPDTEALRSALDSRDPWILVAVAEEFETLALAGKDVPTAELVRLLSNKEQAVQLAAAPCAIAAGGVCTPAIVTAYADALPGKAPEVQAEVAAAILGVSPPVDVSSETLTNAFETHLMQSPELSRRRKGLTFTSLRASWLASSRQSDPDQRVRAADCSARWGPSARPFAERLLPLLDDSSSAVPCRSGTPGLRRCG